MMKVPAAVLVSSSRPDPIHRQATREREKAALAEVLFKEDMRAIPTRFGALDPIEAAGEAAWRLACAMFATVRPDSSCKHGLQCPV